MCGVRLQAGQRPACYPQVWVTLGTRPDLWDLMGQPPLGCWERGAFTGEMGRTTDGARGQVLRPQGSAPVHGVTATGQGRRDFPDDATPWLTRPSSLQNLCRAPGGRGEALLDRESLKAGLTGVDKPPRSTFTELLGLVGQGDLDDSGNVPRRGLDADGVGRDQLQEPHSEEAFSSAGPKRRTLASWTQLPKMSKIGPSSWNAPSEQSPRLRTYSCAFREMSANDPGCSLQERPQGIIHMKIATICLLKPAPSNSSTNCSRALGTFDGRFETPGLG